MIEKLPRLIRAGDCAIDFASAVAPRLNWESWLGSAEIRASAGAAAATAATLATKPIRVLYLICPPLARPEPDRSGAGAVPGPRRRRTGRCLSAYTAECAAVRPPAARAPRPGRSARVRRR